MVKVPATAAWKVADFISALGLIVAIVSLIWTQCTTNAHLEINLARDLIKEFFSEDEKSRVFHDMRRAIEQCRPIYKSWGGHFDNDQVNRYLGFFEDLGFYRKRGVLTLESIDHGFGSYIIEAFEHPHVKRYILGLRAKADQFDAFIQFEALAKQIEGRSARANEVQTTRDGCSEVKSR